MKTSEQIIEISTALAKLQGTIGQAKKDVKAYNYFYADLAQILDLIKEAMCLNGLTVIQDTAATDVGVSVTTRILHNSGQWIETSPLVIPIAKKDAHAIGSAITYGRRYQLCALIGIASTGEDDDGAAAIKPGKEAPQSSKASNDEVNSFFAKYERLGKEIVTKFLKHRCELLKCNGASLISTYLANESGFLKDFENWLAKNQEITKGEDV